METEKQEFKLISIAANQEMHSYTFLRKEKLN